MTAHLAVHGTAPDLPGTALTDLLARLRGLLDHRSCPALLTQRPVSLPTGCGRDTSLAGGHGQAMGPVVVTTCGPLARAFREAAQSIAPSAIVPGGLDARKLVQLAAAPAPEDRLRVVEEMLAASAVVRAYADYLVLRARR
jgi:hypothetical protein